MKTSTTHSTLEQRRGVIRLRKDSTNTKGHPMIFLLNATGIKRLEHAP